MAEAEDNRNTPTSQQVLEVLQGISRRCNDRLPQVTSEIEELARKLADDVLTDQKEQLALSLQGLSGLQQFMQAVAAHLPTLVAEIAEQPSQAKMEEYCALRSALPFWHKMAATEFIQRAQLAANDPLVLKPRKDLAVVQTFVFAWVQPVLEKAGIRTQGSASPTSIACRATAALINRFTDHRTTAQAVSSQVRDQFEIQDQALSALAESGKKAP